MRSTLFTMPAGTRAGRRCRYRDCVASRLRCIFDLIDAEALRALTRRTISVSTPYLFDRPAELKSFGHFQTSTSN
jgi:hypothetical protein